MHGWYIQTNRQTSWLTEPECWCCLGWLAAAGSNCGRPPNVLFFSFSWVLPPPARPPSILLLLTPLRNRAAEPSPLRAPPTCSRGSQMIKAVAGGLHFETINRPVGAESNGKPSIFVSPSRFGSTEGREARRPLSEEHGAALDVDLHQTRRSSRMIKSSYRVILCSHWNANTKFWTFPPKNKNNRQVSIQKRE